MTRLFSKRRFWGLWAGLGLLSCLEAGAAPCLPSSRDLPDEIILAESLDASVAAAAASHDARPPSDPSRPPTTLLITHPLRHVLDNYITLVARGLLQVPNLRIIGIFHAEESEDYRAAQSYLEQHHVDWITLRPLRCAVDAASVYKQDTCREDIARLMDQSDGLVLNGGDDLPPALYGQPTFGPTQVLTPQRHYFETAMMVQLLGSTRAPAVEPLLAKRPDYPILAICVGMQTMNVAAGGDLIQDIHTQLYQLPDAKLRLLAQQPSALSDRNMDSTQEPHVSLGAMHPIHTLPHAPDFLLQASVDGIREPKVLSIHHQAIDTVGAGFSALATSADGRIVEAIGRLDFPNVLGLQFHPERRAMWDGRIREQLRQKAAPHQFVYDWMQSDPFSRSAHAGVWQWLASRLSTRPVEKKSQS